MKIPRIVFNFNDRCLNGCPFCFIPFDNKGAGTPEIWRKVLARIDELDPGMISFSGCDPLFYSEFYDVLRDVPKTRKWGMDTSLIFLDREKFSEIYNKFDLFSTSLDDTLSMNKFQRYPTAKLNRFYENFDYVNKFFPQIVVHTLYSSLNKNHLEEIVETLISKGVKTWVLYQYWPFGFIKSGADFVCDEKSFIDDAERMAAYCNDRIYYEYFPYRGRANGYFFVSSLGNAYTTVESDPSYYLPLGSVFDDDIIEKWEKHSNPAKAEDIYEKKLLREGLKKE